jgi:hypothetical protein
MKTIYILIAVLMIALSLETFADDKVKNNKLDGAAVAVAPQVWGNPDTNIPVELATLKAKNAFVPVAPFVWGSSEEMVSIDNEKFEVPVAPFVFGAPDEEAPQLAEIR